MTWAFVRRLSIQFLVLKSKLSPLESDSKVNTDEQQFYHKELVGPNPRGWNFQVYYPSL